jgi:HK97 family phage major capsid protein
MGKDQILARIKELMVKQQGIYDKAKTENSRALTEDEVKDFNASQKEIENLKAQLETLEKMEANAKFMDEPATKTMIPIDIKAGTQGEILDDGGFKNLGEFMFCVKNGDSKGRLKALSTSDVGIMIPAQFSQNIMKLNGEDELVMPRATNIPAGDPPDAPFTIPYLQQGADGVLGGIQLNWTGEAKTVKDIKDPVLKDLTLTPNEVSGLATINNKTLQNWGAAGALVENLMRQAYVAGRDHKFLRGSGAGCPLGVILAPGAIKIKRTTAATVTYLDVVTMLGRLLPEALGKALFVASITLLPVLMTMKDDADHYIFNAGDATRGIPATLAGLPLKFTGKTPTRGTEGDLMLVDLSFYLTKAGSGPYVSVSEHVKFTTNQTVFKIVANIDGQPWVKDPLKLEDGVTTVSPYIILK